MKKEKRLKISVLVACTILASLCTVGVIILYNSDPSDKYYNILGMLGWITSVALCIILWVTFYNISIIPTEEKDII